MKQWFAIAVLFLLLSGCTGPTPAIVPSTRAVEGTTISPIASVVANNTPSTAAAAPTIPPTSIPTLEKFNTPPRPTFAPITQPLSPAETRKPNNPNLNLDTSSPVLVRATALLYDRFNKARAANGAPPLQADPILETIARIRSGDMLTRNYFSHQDPATGADLISPLLQQYNYPAGFWGENLVTIQGRKLDAENLSQYFANSWLASPGHADNILNPNFRHTGLGLVASADGFQVIATQIFAE